LYKIHAIALARNLVAELLEIEHLCLGDVLREMLGSRRAAVAIQEGDAHDAITKSHEPVAVIPEPVGRETLRILGFVATDGHIVILDTGLHTALTTCIANRITPTQLGLPRGHGHRSGLVFGRVCCAERSDQERENLTLFRLPQLDSTDRTVGQWPQARAAV